MSPLLRKNWNSSIQCLAATHSHRLLPHMHNTNTDTGTRSLDTYCSRLVFLRLCMPFVFSRAWNRHKFVPINSVWTEHLIRTVAFAIAKIFKLKRFAWALKINSMSFYQKYFKVPKVMYLMYVWSEILKTWKSFPRHLQKKRINTKLLNRVI